MVFRHDLDHLTAFPFIFLPAADDFYSITFANFYFHSLRSYRPYE